MHGLSRREPSIVSTSNEGEYPAQAPRNLWCSDAFPQPWITDQSLPSSAMQVLIYTLTSQWLSEVRLMSYRCDFDQLSRTCTWPYQNFITISASTPLSLTVTGDENIHVHVKDWKTREGCLLGVLKRSERYHGRPYKSSLLKPGGSCQVEGSRLGLRKPHR